MQSIRSYVDNALQRYQDILGHGDESRGLPTGFSLLDAMINGLQPGGVYVIASRPSMGKTTLLLNILSQVALEQQTPSMFFSGELTSAQIVNKLIFNRARVPLGMHSDPEHCPTKGDLMRIHKCSRELASSGLVLENMRNMTLETIVAKSREEQTKIGIRFIAIDHLHLIRSESTQPGTSRKREMTGVMREIKNLARELELPVLVSAQLKRRADGRVPRIRDIRQSRSIEEEADFVGMLHREGSITEKDRFELLIAKNNNGPSGTVCLFFDRVVQLFEQGRPVRYEENEMIIAWRDYLMEKDFPQEMD
jgi:replicative DNA helicase